MVIIKCLVIFLISIHSLVVSDETVLNGFIRANNLFASNLYSELAKSKIDNFIVSPLSAEVILTLAQSGCKQETAQELKSALHLPDTNEEIKLGVKETHFNTSNNNHYTLVSANKIYVKKDFHIKEEFKNVATETYKVDIENIDFEKNVEATKIMNDWVKEQTHNKIQNLIDPADIDDLTRLVLINVLYFKGNWSTQFRSTATKKKDFYKLDQEVIKLDMMHHYGQKFNYYENNELSAKFLELPFKGGDVSMVIILPNDKDGIVALEKQIDKVFYPQQMRRELVNVALPKFKIESTIKLKTILQNLGVIKVFKKNLADLSGIAGEKGDLVISDLLQKAFLEIEEKGGEAAAATYVLVGFMRSGIGSYRPQPKDFIADHPFIFYIKVKNFIIFAGRVLKPIY